MYKYVERVLIPDGDNLSIAVLEDNDGEKKTISEFLERDRKGFMVRWKTRSILIELDWCNRVKVSGAYPGEVAMFPFIPLFSAAMDRHFHINANEEFKQILRELFSLDFKKELELLPK